MMCIISRSDVERGTNASSQSPPLLKGITGEVSVKVHRTVL